MIFIFMERHECAAAYFLCFSQIARDRIDLVVTNLLGY